MSYSYAAQRSYVFSEDGQPMFLSIRDHAQRLLKHSGAVTSGALMGTQTGDTWNMLTCIDRLVELGELREINYGDCAGQDRIFMAPYRRG